MARTLAPVFSGAARSAAQAQLVCYWTLASRWSFEPATRPQATRRTSAVLRVDPFSCRLSMPPELRRACFVPPTPAIRAHGVLEGI